MTDLRVLGCVMKHAVTRSSVNTHQIEFSSCLCYTCAFFLGVS